MTPAAIAEAWNACSDRLLAAGLRLTHGDLLAAEDLLSETFFRASTADFRGESTTFTFLYVIQRRAFISARRKEETSRNQRARIAPTISRTQGESDPVCAAEEAERADLLRDELDHLPEPQRAALASIYFDGRAYHDTAVRMGVPLGTLKSRVHAARESLRERLRGRIE